MKARTPKVQPKEDQAGLDVQPVRYSDAIAEQIVDRLSNGEPLREITRSAGMPHWRTVYRWMSEHEEFRRGIAGAREIGFDAIAESCLETADTPEIGVIETVRTGGKNPGLEVRTGDMVERSRLKIWTRLQLLAKWFPTKYGDRVALDHTVKSDLAERIIAGRKRALGK